MSDNLPPPPPSGPATPPEWNPAGAPPPAFPTPPKKKSGAGKIIAIILGVLVLLAVICVVVVLVVGVKIWGNSAANAEVGDCLPATVLTESLTDVAGQTKVDCGSDKAAFKVVGFVDGKKYAETTLDDCKLYPTADNGLWIGEDQSKPGKVYCLQTLKK